MRWVLSIARKYSKVIGSRILWASSSFWIHKWLALVDAGEACVLQLGVLLIYKKIIKQNDQFQIPISNSNLFWVLNSNSKFKFQNIHAHTHPNPNSTVPHTVPTPKPQHTQTLPTITLFSQCLCLLLLPSHCWLGGRNGGLGGGRRGKKKGGGGGGGRRRGKKEGKAEGKEEGRRRWGREDRGRFYRIL